MYRVPPSGTSRGRDFDKPGLLRGTPDCPRARFRRLGRCTDLSAHVKGEVSRYVAFPAVRPVCEDEEQTDDGGAAKEHTENGASVRTGKFAIFISGSSPEDSQTLPLSAGRASAPFVCRAAAGCTFAAERPPSSFGRYMPPAAVYARSCNHPRSACDPAHHGRGLPPLHEFDSRFEIAHARAACASSRPYVTSTKNTVPTHARIFEIFEECCTLWARTRRPHIDLRTRVLRWRES